MAKASRKDARMTPPVSPKVQLTIRQRTCLEQILRRQTSPQRLVRRAKILLALETGANECHVMRQMHLNRETVRVWRRRWLALVPQLEQLEADEGSDKALCTMIVEALPDHPRPGAPAPGARVRPPDGVAGSGRGQSQSALPHDRGGLPRPPPPGPARHFYGGTD